MVAEEVVGLEVSANFIVVHFAGHDVPLDHVGIRKNWVGEFFLGETHQADESVGKETEKGQFGVKTQVEHAFGMVEAQTSALASAHDANTNFSFGNRFESDGVKLIRNFDKLCSGTDIFDRRELNLQIGINEFGVEKDMPEELISLLKVDAFELL